MPNAETTFDDRLGRGRLMQQTIAGFAPPFTPTDPDIDPPTFASFLDSIEAKNLAVKNGRSAYTTGSGQRITIVKDVKTRSKMTRSYVESVGSYKAYRATVKNIVKKITGYRPPKPKLPRAEARLRRSATSASKALPRLRDILIISFRP